MPKEEDREWNLNNSHRHISSEQIINNAKADQ